MSYFRSHENLELDKEFALEGDEARHLVLSRRIKLGERILIQDSQQKRFLCRVDRINHKTVSFTPIDRVPTPPEPNLILNLYQALVSESALDIILSKSTELGASTIHIFPAELSPNSIGAEVTKKLNRWQKICQEAAKQSDRSLAPIVSWDTSVQTAIDFRELKFTSLFLQPHANNPGTFKSAPGFNIFVGPEGGWSENELMLAGNTQGITAVTFGPRVLKADTAAIAAIAVLSHNFGDLH